MVQSILYINMYIPVTGTVGAKHSSHIRLFKEITYFFTTNKMLTFNVFRKVRTMLASKLLAAQHIRTRA
jgi:hypothetical protein